MNTEMAYFKFVNLPKEVKQANNIRSKVRIDCIAYSDEVAGGYKGLEPFYNHKRQLFLYKTPAREFISAESKRVAEWSLTKSSMNLSSLYIEDMDYPEIAYGYPNGKRLLTNGSENPLYPFRNDGYLFIMNKDITELELLVIPENRNLISSYYNLLIDGELDEEIKQLRQNTKPFYDYGYSKL